MFLDPFPVVSQQVALKSLKHWVTRQWYLGNFLTQHYIHNKERMSFQTDLQKINLGNAVDGGGKTEVGGPGRVRMRFLTLPYRVRRN